MVDALAITGAQLVDLGLLVGTDFHPGIKGIGPKKALMLVSRYGAIEQMPDEIRGAFGADLDDLRRIYLEPDVSNESRVEFRSCDAEAVVRFLCDEHAFGRDRVAAALERAFGRSQNGVCPPLSEYVRGSDPVLTPF
jgi:flap endonuclease-1